MHTLYDTYIYMHMHMLSPKTEAPGAAAEHLAGERTVSNVVIVIVIVLVLVLVYNSKSNSNRNS